MSEMSKPDPQSGFDIYIYKHNAYSTTMQQNPKTPGHMTTTKPTTADDVTSCMTAMADNTQRDILMKFFKTGKGEYGEGDMFLGIRVPKTREVAERAADLDFHETERLLLSEWHEVRLCGFLILAERMRRLSFARLRDDEASVREREKTVQFYLRFAPQANNWDLVDLSAPKIVGAWLTLPSAASEEDKFLTLDRLSDSPCLWEQRIAIVSTYAAIHEGDLRYTLRYAERLLGHSHDLMHKAVGWMLRELGKRDISVLRSFLEKHHDGMSRTTLRYAIERMGADEKRMWMRRR